MSEYTPRTHEIRAAAVVHRAPLIHRQMPGRTILDAERVALAEFDRWLAEVERAAAEKAHDALLIELLPVLKEAVSNAYLCQNDRGVGNDWVEEIKQAEAALERAEAAERRTKENRDD